MANQATTLRAMVANQEDAFIAGLVPGRVEVRHAGRQRGGDVEAWRQRRFVLRNAVVRGVDRLDEHLIQKKARFVEGMQEATNSGRGRALYTRW